MNVVLSRGAAGSPATHRRTVVRALLDRWPTAVALGMSLTTIGGSAASLGEVLPLLALHYLISAKIRRRWASWPLLAAALALVVGLGLLGVPSFPVITAIAFAVLVWGAVDGQLRKDGVFRVQALGMIGFGLVGLAGIVVDPDLGRYLVAAGWFAHGIWDFVHLRLDRTVQRSYAEWCGVVDVVIAVALVLS